MQTSGSGPVASGPVALALDFGGTKVESALVDGAGRLLPGSRFRAPTGPSASSEGLWESVASVLDAALAAVGDRELIGVGIGTAGPIDERAGLVSPLNVPQWRGFPFRDRVVEWLRDRATPAPVTLRMDGLAITLADHWIGAAGGVDNVMGMVVSTGIGGGLILGGATVSGPTGNAGHIGHIEVGGFDVRCACGGTGCVEAVASGPRSVAWARSQGWTGNSGEQLATAYTAGDAIARAAVRRAGTAIGRAIASAAALTDLEVVAVGGGFSRVSPDLFGFIREAIDERAEFGFVKKVQVVPSGLSDEGPLIGAAALIHRAAVVTGSAEPQPLGSST
ncbi:ROK family protein [Lysobacter korlensis]|uniref:ROK family protein n=1 Tax=Lysobacter korlensis TaxID=553636 RepID=A0ABV6RYN1_9GAMM